MDVTGRNIWQVAAGDKNRNYVDLCLQWGVILNGPGSAGCWPDCLPVLRDAWGVSARKITDLRRFCEEIKDGDLVVLRLGTGEIFGVGIVVGDYVWNSEFGDVDGWDLEHIRRVRWLWSDKQGKQFPAYTMKLGDTVQLLDSQDVINWFQQLTVDSSASDVDIPDLPVPLDSGVDLDTIAEFLFDNGVASASIQGLTGEIDELFRIARWYQKTENPSEHETVAYLVVPLLRALGWTPQKMAIEWNHVDLALFSKLPRTDRNLSVVVEAKQKGRSCLTAKSQAQSYASGPDRDSCTRLIVTDGLRYGVYLRCEDGGFEEYPQAYLNLTSLRAAYPIYGCQGAKEALLAMSSDWNGTPFRSRATGNIAAT